MRRVLGESCGKSGVGPWLMADARRRGSVQPVREPQTRLGHRRLRSGARGQERDVGHGGLKSHLEFIVKRGGTSQGFTGEELFLSPPDVEKDGDRQRPKQAALIPGKSNDGLGKAAGVDMMSEGCGGEVRGRGRGGLGGGTGVPSTLWLLSKCLPTAS